MISRYGGREILASITEDEIVENFLSIVRYGLKYFNLTGIGVYYFSLHKKWSFPLRISSVNVTNPQETADLVTFTEEILHGKLHFLCSVWVKIFDLKDNNSQWNPVLLIIEISMCSPISNVSLKRLFNQMNTVKSNVQIGWQIQRQAHFWASKFQKFLSILFIKITFQGVLITVSKRKAREWRKENTSANSVQSQKF